MDSLETLSKDKSFMQGLFHHLRRYGTDQRHLSEFLPEGTLHDFDGWFDRRKLVEGETLDDLFMYTFTCEVAPEGVYCTEPYLYGPRRVRELPDGVFLEKAVYLGNGGTALSRNSHVVASDDDSLVLSHFDEKRILVRVITSVELQGYCLI